MTLAIFTIAYQAQPFIERHLPIFEQLSVPFHWIVVHGPSQNGGSTAWCQKQKPGLSTDGTTEYLRSIRNRGAVTVIERENWKSKDQMVNAALSAINEPCTLMQIDADEIWSPAQLETIVRLFVERPTLSSIMFACRYYVGEKLVLSGENCFGDNNYEWLRAWRYEPGRKFVRHEPPVLEGDDPARRMSKVESRALGLVFNHYAYALESQVAYKAGFYGYGGAGIVESWRKLQSHDKLPVAANRFFPWLDPDDKAMVVKASAQ